MRKVITTAWWVALAAVVTAAPASSVNAPIQKRPPIVFTQLARGASWTSEPYAGAQIGLLSPAGAVKILTAGFESAADPNVAWDGKKILFAARKTAKDLWQIYEMNADGSGARQLVETTFDCRQPIYQSKIFYLDDPGPIAQISFAGKDAAHLTEDRSGPLWSLYSARFDGTGLRRLSYNPSNDLDPVMNQDGRILYSSIQRHSLRWGPAGRAALMGINLDGTDVALFAADEGRLNKRMPCATPSGQIVFVESDTNTPDGGGNLASVETRRPLHSYVQISKPGDGYYRAPSALDEEDLLVAKRPASGTAVFSIYRFQPKTGLSVKIYGDPVRSIVQAKAVVPHAMPEGRSSVVDEKDPNGKLYCLSVFHTELPGEMKHDASNIKRVRVLEGVPASADQKASRLLEKRVLGEFDVDPDGSFHVRLPANVPVQIQTLDASGMALRTSAWIWVKNKQIRGCVGCHDDPELSPESVFATSLERPAIELTRPVQARKTFGFEKDVQPIFAAKCSSNACHGGNAADPLNYEDLVGMKLIEPGAARLSPLVWTTEGHVTVQPWDHVQPGKVTRAMPPVDAKQLTADEKRIILEWIDTGAHR